MAGLSLSQRVRLRNSMAPYEEAFKNAAGEGNLGTASGIPELDNAFKMFAQGSQLPAKTDGRLPVKTVPVREDMPVLPPVPPTPQDPVIAAPTPTSPPGVTLTTRNVPSQPAMVDPAPAPRVVADMPATPDPVPAAPATTPTTTPEAPKPTVADLWGEGKYGDALTAGLNNSNLMGGLKGLLSSVSNKPAQTQIPPAPADTTIGGGPQAIASAQQLMNSLMARRTKGRGLSLTGMM